MNYEYYTEGIFFGIRYTEDESDGDEVFETFTEAKQAMLARLRRKRDEYALAVTEATKYKKAYVEEARS